MEPNLVLKLGIEVLEFEKIVPKPKSEGFKNLKNWAQTHTQRTTRKKVSKLKRKNELTLWCLFAYVRAFSTGPQYVNLNNKIKCLSLAAFFLGNPTNKTVTGTAWRHILSTNGDALMLVGC
jgi:hypothetical protein